MYQNHGMLLTLNRTLVEVHITVAYTTTKYRNKYYYQVLFVATATTTVKILEAVVLNQFCHPRPVRSPLVVSEFSGTQQSKQKFPGQKGNGGSNYVTKLMFANKDVLSIIPILRQKTKQGFPLCAEAVK